MDYYWIINDELVKLGKMSFVVFVAEENAPLEITCDHGTVLLC